MLSIIWCSAIDTCPGSAAFGAECFGWCGVQGGGMLPFILALLHAL